MGFHADSIVELVPGTGVAVVSLGAARTLRFRRIDDKSVLWDCPLPNGSLLYMPPEVQLAWKHGVPETPGAGPRISLTFRRLRPAVEHRL
jgi:alkylated DNA repair dioxygenase AlkB